MKLVHLNKLEGITLVETLMSVSIGSFMLAAVLTSGVALQRSLCAVEGYSIAQSDQLRVLDYVAMDCRRAIDVSVANNALTVTLPPYYTSLGTPATPTLTSGSLSYGANTVQVTYSQNGSYFDRTINTSLGGLLTGSSTKHIATNVSTFNVTPVDQSTVNGTVNCSITFSPRFTNLPGPGPVSGTTVYSSTFLRNARARQ